MRGAPDNPWSLQIAHRVFGLILKYVRIFLSVWSWFSIVRYHSLQLGNSSMEKILTFRIETNSFDGYKSLQILKHSGSQSLGQRQDFYDFLLAFNEMKYREIQILTA